jgi:hypothetical protein
MRRTTICILAICGLTVAGCGAGAKFANKPRPPLPINLSVYINNAKISISPASVGAGPVNFIVTNMADHAESLSILAAGASAANSLANTGPINPQATAEVTVDFDSPGTYSVTTTPQGQTDAALAEPPTIHPAMLHIGRQRPNASGALLQP